LPPSPPVKCVNITSITLPYHSPKTEAEILSNRAASQIHEYISGERTFFDLPFDLEGYSLFRRDVWRCLCSIPFGSVLSYGEVAAFIDNPLSSRAVGQACGSNPVPLMIPCHRVVGAHGKIGGFSIGLDWKHFLFKHEGIVL